MTSIAFSTFYSPYTYLGTAQEEYLAFPHQAITTTPNNGLVLGGTTTGVLDSTYGNGVDDAFAVHVSTPGACSSKSMKSRNN